MTQKRVVGIVGTGLIGGSIGMRSRRDGALVVGYDADAAALALALEVGAIDYGATRDELYARAGTVVLSAYVDGIVAEIERLRKEGPIRAQLIVDIASVKAPIVTAARGLRNFVATHPMAGTEHRGVRAANPDLFEARTWAFVPSGDEALDARAKAFIASCGAAPLSVEAEEHDCIVGFTSHLPQLIAWAYERRAKAHESDAFEPLLGRTAAELLRLGRSGYGFWESVFTANRVNVESDLRALIALLAESADALHSGDALRP